MGRDGIMDRQRFRIWRHFPATVALAGGLLSGCVTTDTAISTAKTRLAASESATVIPRSLSGGYLAARQAYRGRDVRAAANFYSDALSRDPEDLALMRQGFLMLVEDGRMPAAIALARKVYPLDENAPAVRLTLALAAAKDGDFETALELIDKLPASRLNDILRPLLGAWAATGQDDQAEAERRMAKVRAMQGFELLAHLHDGYMAQVRGDDKAADEAFALAAGRSTHPPLRLRIAAALHFARTKRLDRAHDMLQGARRGDADIAVIAKIADRVAAGGVAIEAVPDAVAGLSEAMFDVASALQRDRGSETALLYGRLAVHLRTEFPLASLLVGEILDDRGRHSEAIEIYDRIPSSSPYHGMARLRAASGLVDLGRTEDAMAVLREQTKARAEDPGPPTRLGDILRREKRWVESVSAYDKAVQRHEAEGRRDWSIFYTRGIALERAKLWDRAEADFLTALELKPDQPYVLNYLGYSWVEQGINLSRAEKMIERAVKLRPDDGYIIDSLGWVLYRTGRYDAAVAQLERAVELKPSDATINNHLGDAYWRVGRKAEAAFQWRRALSFDPEPELKMELSRKLKDGLAPKAGTSPQTTTSHGAKSPGA
jgi:tetratricopeptide (TPR) repeat protein